MRIRVGIIGGGFGTKVHLPAFRLDRRFEVRGLWSRNPKKAAEIARKEKIPLVYSDWRKMIRDPLLDAFSVAVPANLQPEIILESLQQRKPIFFEKPLSAGLGPARQIQRISHKKNIPSLIDFEFPEAPLWKKAKKVVNSGQLGKLQQVIILWKIPYPNPSKIKPSWKDQEKMGGGLLFNFGPHTLNYVEWFFGRVNEINCSSSLLSLSLHLKTKNKIPISIFLTRIPDERYHGIWVCGEKGTMKLENSANDYIYGFQLKISKGREDFKVSGEEKKIGTIFDGRIPAVAKLVNKFGRWIKTGKKEGPSIEAGVRVEELMAAAKKSSRFKKWIKV